MQPFKLIITLAPILFSTVCGTDAPIQATPSRLASVSDMWLDISMGPPLVDWFNELARPEDIARADHVSQVGLLAGIKAGQRLVVFKSAADAERMVPDIAGRIDIIGYNLEHGPNNPPDEQADPVGSIKRMRRLADRYGLALALGPDHRFALSDGVALAPYVDIFVLQVQLVQTEPARVRDFVIPTAAALREANPDLEISAQIRTEGDVVEIADLIESMKDSLDGVSILTSPETVDVAEALVKELRARTDSTPQRTDDSAREASNPGRPASDTNIEPRAQAEPGEASGTTAAWLTQTNPIGSPRFWGVLFIGFVGGGLLTLIMVLVFQNRASK